MDELENTEITQPDVEQSEQVETSTEPSSMLEAIEQGMASEPEESSIDEDGQPRDEQGRFAAKPEEAKPALPEPTNEPEDDLAMPEGLGKKAQERFKKLTGYLHESNARVKQLEADTQQFREVLKATGGSPQQIGQALNYVGMMTRGDLEGALRLIEQERKTISLLMGKPLQGADTLAAFPDLRQRVDAYQMDEQAAIEIARARTMQAEQQRAVQTMQQGQQRQQVAQQEKQQAIQRIDLLNAEWSKRDPDFAYKEDIILKQIPEIARNFPPQQWPQQVAMLYQTLSAMPAPVKPSAIPAPLRASGQSGGTKAPSSMLDAITGGLGY